MFWKIIATLLCYLDHKSIKIHWTVHPYSLFSSSFWYLILGSSNTLLMFWASAVFEQEWKAYTIFRPQYSDMLLISSEVLLISLIDALTYHTPNHTLIFWFWCFIYFTMIFDASCIKWKWSWKSSLQSRENPPYKIWNACTLHYNSDTAEQFIFVLHDHARSHSCQSPD